MGGYGSGRTGDRPTCERALRLDAAKLMRDGQLVPGRCSSGSIQWTMTRTGSVVATMGFWSDMRDPEDAWLRLRYTTTRPGAAPQLRDYRVPLDTTLQHFGGVRWWFRCPATGRLSRVLYLPDGGEMFACRSAYKLAYDSQRQTDVDNTVDRSLALRRQLGITDTNTLEVLPVRRPKWMRRPTFLRLYGELILTQEFLVGEAARRFGIKP